MAKRRIFILLITLALLIAASRREDRALALPAGNTLLRASDGVAGDMFGYSVDFDGATIVAGAPRAMIDGVQQQGAVYVFKRDGDGGWIEAAKLWDSSGEEYDWFGSAVAVAGNVIAVGVPFKDGGGFTQQGLVYIYERDPADPDDWVLVATKGDSTLDSFANFGYDVALDGDRLIVGAPGADLYGVSHAGAAYIYERDEGGPGNWSRIVRLRDVEGHDGDEFGSAVDIRADTAVVGARQADVMAVQDNEGAAFVFDRDFAGLGTWAQVQRLAPSHFADNAKFGDAVAIDGTTILVGAWGFSTIPANGPPEYSYGKAFVYEEAYIGANNWARMATLGASDRADFDFFGNDVAISGDMAVIGAPTVDDGILRDQGAIYRYGRDTGGSDNWGEIDKIPPAEGTVDDYFGSSVAIAGSEIVVGSYGSDAGQGVVYVIDDGPTPAPVRTTAFLPLIMHLTVSPITPNGVLVDGGVFQDSSGAVIGAVEGTLSEPLEISLETTTEPAKPYTDDANPIGPYYRLGAVEDFYTPPGKPFLVGLPVPVGANPDDLAVAILEPAEFVLDSTATGEIWHVTRGAYDPSNNLFSFTLSNLNPAGLTAILVEHPDNELLLTFAHPNDKLTETSVRWVSEQDGGTRSFSVSCGSTDSQAACTPDILNDVKNEVTRAYNDFTGLGFLEPALNWHVAQFLSDLLQPDLIEYTDFHEVYVFDVNAHAEFCDEFLGMYFPSTQDIVICVEPVLGVNKAVVGVIRHELFHAIQYAYPELQNLEDWQQSWVLDGTATAAMDSLGTMRRSQAPAFNVRQIRPSLISDAGVQEYQAQDFWVYTGASQSPGWSLDYLIPIFETGAEPADVAHAIDLGPAYWDYVKNQIVEKTVHFDPQVTGPPCQIVTNLIGNQPSENQIDFPSSSFEQGSLAPLSAVVVEVTFNQAYPWVNITAGDGSGIEKYKVYENGESGCEAVPDGERDFEDVEIGEKRYVVLANTSHVLWGYYTVLITAE